MPDAVLDLTGKLRAITVHVHALQPPLQPNFEEGYVSEHARANRVHVTSLGSADPAGRTAVQVPDRSGTWSGIESQPVLATMVLALGKCIRQLLITSVRLRCMSPLLQKPLQQPSGNYISSYVMMRIRISIPLQILSQLEKQSATCCRRWGRW